MTDNPSWVGLALAVALLLALLGAITALVLTETGAVRGMGGESGDAAPRRRSKSAEPERPGRAPRPAIGGDAPHTERHVAIVVNPSKFTDVAKVRTSLTEVCREHGWAEPMWLETTIEDPGTGQTEQALKAGVDLVCALGGDGTVRIVGAGLADTGMPLGLLAAGTGNLLARNLKLPIDSPSKALTIALTGRNKPIDTCGLSLTRPTEQQLRERVEDDEPSDNVDLRDAADNDADSGRHAQRVEDHIFLVMAGLGFDAEVMAGVPEALKAKVGWVAYLVSGARHLKGPQFVADVRLEDGTRIHRRARSVIVGNVGRLQGGVVLMPDAAFDDGVIDMVLISPRGMVGWGAVAAQLLTRQLRGHRRVEHIKARNVRVEASKPVEMQLDGDTMGQVKVMQVVVHPESLIVRIPA